MPFVPAARVAFLFLVSPIIAAQQPWNGVPFQAPPAAVLAAAGDAATGESDVVVLLDELHYSFDEAGRATASSRLVFRIVDESAIDDWSTVETEWVPWYHERPVLTARVVSADGTVHMLDPKAITESAARDESPDVFSDNRVLRAPLPGMAAGSVVEQVITHRDRNPLFETGTGGRLMFGRMVPVEKTRLVIDAPSSLAIRFVNKSSPRIEPVKSEIGGRQQIVFERSRLEPLEDLEWNLPSDESSIPYISFSTGTSWAEGARRYAAIVDEQIGEPGAVKSFLNRAIGGATDRREIVSKALEAIQKNVRYAGVEVGEGSIVPRSPARVLELKYGDCKDKATLLVAMLRAAGIPAHVVLLNAGTGLDVDAELPGLSRFNHAIVRVGGGEPIWVDPTDEYSPAGVLPIGDQDRLVLVADASSTGLTRTPASDSTANFTRETRTFTLADEGKATVKEVTEATGANEASMRRFAAEADKKDYREAMKDYVIDAYAAESLANLIHTDPRDLTTPFRLTMDIEEAGRGQTSDIDAAVGIMPAALLEGFPWALREMTEEDADEPKKKRTRDFVMPAPYVKELHYRIVPPPGFVARTLPPDENRPLGTASLSAKYEVAPDGAVLATLRFDSGKRRLTPAEMESTRAAVSTFASANAIIVGFDSLGWSKLNAGDIGGAIAEFRKLATLHPKEARHHVQIGRAHFVGGMAEVAREELRRAIKLEPKYAPAHRFLGIALQHDLLAREFRKGFDLPGALAAYRKAKELAPRDVDTRVELAKLLSRGDDGQLYTRGARFAESIDEYKAVAAELKDARFEGEMLNVMAHAGRFDEMKKYAREVKDQSQRLTALVVAIAATDGVEAALREAASVDTNVRRAILSAAFPNLLQLRRYPEAAVILEQASQGGPNAAQVRPLLDMLKRTKRSEDLRLGDDPASVVLRVSLAAISEADPHEATRKYAASWLLRFEDDLKARPLTGEMLRTKMESKAASTRRNALKQGLPMNVAMEIGLGAMELSQEGNDETGHRVRMRLRTAVPGAKPISETFYIVRENERYVIAASTHASVGVSVLHFADVNDLESARTWLNWVREEIGAGGGDDPLASPPFAALWPKSKATATAAEIRAAASVLLVSDSDYAPVAVERLLAVRDSVPEELRVRVDLALVGAQSQIDAKDRVEVARRIFEAAPDSAVAFSIYAAALATNGQAEEARRIAGSRLEKLPNDRDALRMLSEASASTGDFEAAIGYLSQIIHRLDPQAGDYNNRAWNALFAGKPMDEAVLDANHAVSLEPSPGVMHTLAAVYAEAGNSLEAREKLLESMDLADREEPDSVDWYVLGRIAENYGATDAALAAYQRVTRPKRAHLSSTYELTQRRLRVLRRESASAAGR
jgi:tetratricopeptide (TPR) repeat protein